MKHLNQFSKIIQLVANYYIKKYLQTNILYLYFITIQHHRQRKGQI